MKDPVGIKPVLQLSKSSASFGATAKLLLSDSRARRDAPRWAASLVRRLRRRELGVEPHPVPCITFGALDWLQSAIRPEWRVFEWGSGASTLYYADKGAEVVAVEHFEPWANLVGSKLRDRGSRGSVLHRPAERGESRTGATSARPEFAGSNFDRYVSAIDEVGGFFDLIVIDGRARVACGARAEAHLAPGGVILLDNSERARYEPLFRQFDHLMRTDYSGLGPYSAAPWRTTVWRSNGAGPGSGSTR